MLPLLPLLIACSWFGPSEPPGPPFAKSPPAERGPTGERALHLAYLAPTQVEVPPSVRPEGAAAPDTAKIPGPYTRRGETWVAPLPVRSSALMIRTQGARTFGTYAPPGMSVTGPDGPLSFAPNASEPGSWGFTQDRMVFRAPSSQDPNKRPFSLTFPQGAARENDLNAATSRRSGAAFVQRSITQDLLSHTGLLLPAPASAAWTVDVPVGARITWRGTILAPEVPSATASDGATVRVEWSADGATWTELGAAPLAVDVWEDAAVELTEIGGKRVQLRLRTDPGASSTLDYAFLEDPTIYVPKERPHHAVLVFVDTLRHDHLGIYGYERPTSPTLDALALQSAVFRNARNVAPWTLPSTRSALSGAQPERWSEVKNLAERLGASGFATRGVVANTFLSASFDMHRGFGRYEYQHLHPASGIVDVALAALDELHDRDAVVMLHFMDAHLPYREPPEYRKMFAKEKPPGLARVQRVDLIKVRPEQEDFASIRDFVIGRYDGNIRMIDDQLARVFAAVDPSDTVVVFSDHGEEFWEHGGYEHGHAFWDELLRVPLIIRDPRMQPGFHDAPVSLLDLTPTVLDLLGADASAEDGHPLAAVTAGDAAAIAALEARPQAFGRPLYGQDGWGVVADGHKWWSRGADEVLFDLAADPGEQTPGEPDESWPKRAGDALDRPFEPVVRIQIDGPIKAPDATLRITHPSGIPAAWAAYDPRGAWERASPRVEDGAVVIDAVPGEMLPPSIFLAIPDGEGLTLTWTRGDAVFEETLAALDPDGRYARFQLGAYRFDATRAWAPRPVAGEIRMNAPETRQQLQELGYLEE